MTEIIKFNDFIRIMDKNLFYDFNNTPKPLNHKINGKKYEVDINFK
jgi:hypothetical protein